MSLSIAVPLLVGSAVAAVATSVHRYLPPRLATRYVTAGVVLVTLAAIPTAALIALSFVAHAPFVGAGFRWCTHQLGVHLVVPAWLGIATLAALAIGTVRTVRLIRQHQRLVCHEARPVRLVKSPRPYAVTLPGRAGQVVISTAMVDLLTEQERRVVLAHEHAHARYRHDRYLLIAALASAALPPLAGLARRVRFSIERWADEAAAASCGDRRLVAATLGKVAVIPSPSTVAGFGGLGVAARVGALLAPPRANLRTGRLVALWCTLFLTASLSAYQLHHLGALISSLCGH